MQSDKSTLPRGLGNAATADVPPIIASMLAQLTAKVDDIHRMLAGRTKSHYTVEEIAEQTGRSAYTVRRWISEGIIVAIRAKAGGPRGRLLIAASELAKLIDSGKGGALS